MAEWLVRHPTQMLPLLDAALLAHIKRNYPKSLLEIVSFRVTKLPVMDKLRFLTHQYIGTLISSINWCK